MSHVIIYQPVKTATQSGRHKDKWVLVYTPVKAQLADNLIGWIGGASTQNQIILKFDECQQAINYARAQGLSFEVIQPQVSTPKKKSYAEKFA